MQLNDALHQGIREYWFQETVFSQEWFEKRFNESRAFIGKRYREYDHVELNVNRTMSFLRRAPIFDEKVNEFQIMINKALKYADRLARNLNESVSKPAATIAEALKAAIVDAPCSPVERLNGHLSQVAILVAKDIFQTQPGLDKLLEELYRKKAKTDELKPHQSAYVHDDLTRDTITKLRESLSRASDTISDLEVRLLSVPHLLVCGEAGSGKSHLLAEEVRQHIKDGGPACFVPSRVIDEGGKPQSEIIHHE